MKRLLLMVLFGVVAQGFAADPIEGQWQTIDDKTGKKRAVVEIIAVGDVFNGTIVGLASDVDPMCQNCAESQRGRPLVGRKILSNIKKQSDGSYADGLIVDPHSGKEYKTIVKLIDNGKQLEARGFIGISLFGRTQTWQRIQ